MSEQFPNLVGESAAEEFRKLSDMLANLKDDRLPIWIADWARDACKDAIVKAEENLMRHEHFGRNLDAATQRQSLAAYRQCFEIIQQLMAYLKALSVEEFERGMKDYFRQGKQDVPTTGAEMKSVARKPRS
jgi:hypothetical protein